MRWLQGPDIRKQNKMYNRSILERHFQNAGKSV